MSSKIYIRRNSNTNSRRTINKIKYQLNELNSKLELADERVSEFEDRLIRILQSEEHREKMKNWEKKKEQLL